MINKYSCINIYETRKKNSKLSSQILYGEKFSIIKKYKDFYKIKTDYDKYVGFIKKRKFEQFAFKPTHKVSSLKANVFSKPIKSSKIKMKLSFTSLLQVKSSNKEFLNFDNYWIQKSDVVPIKYKEKIFKRIKIFRNVKYKWGGKKFDGIDCSGLVQLFYKFNNLYCPRDSGQQFRYFKKLNSINQNLSQTKKIRKFILSNESFSTDNNQLTPTLKIRRHVIAARYIDEINNLYKKSFF